MAVLAPPDWQYLPRDTTMDVPSNNSRQRSPANDQVSPPTPASHPQHQQQLQQQLHQSQHPQQTYTYPLQQQPQGGWTPSIAAQPFYPAFYQNHQQQQSPQPYQTQLPPQAPFYDHTNAQLWAYQQMLFNQVQQGFGHLPPQHHPPQQQQRPGANTSASNDYFAQNQLISNFNPFPSGTPPPHHRPGAGDHQQAQGQQQNGQYSGFHPYRRPNRQASHASEGSDWRPGPHPPYARPDASASSSSLNSASSQRQRTNSNQSGNSGQNTPSVNGRSRIPSPATGPTPARKGSPTSGSSSGSPAPPPSLRGPHHRNTSSSSSASTATSSRASPLSPSLSTTTVSSTTSTTPTSASSSTLRPARPSPLSQGTFTAAEKRMSRDDSDLAAMRDPTPSASMLRSGGLKGRLRRALSFNAAQTLKEEETDDDASIKASTVNGAKSIPKNSLSIDPSTNEPGGGVRSPESGVDDAASTATVQTKKKGRAASLFNSRLNASTDNISLSSTVSSASVMIRKLGSMGKLARRNSLAGITSLFKDKDKDKDKDGDKKGKKKDKDKKGSAKGEASEASVSHATVELDRGSGANDWSVGTEMHGLSPAAKLARQHTLKSNAEAAAKAKAQQEAQAAAAASASAPPKVNGHSPVNGAGVPAWDKNTATKQGGLSPAKAAGTRINEDGTRVFVEEDDDDESDDGHVTGPQHANQGFHADGWDDDEDWDTGEDQEGDEDTTIRVGMERASLDDEGYPGYTEEPEPWAVDIRRSVERSRKPAKGILKHAGTYDQQSYLAEMPNPNRARSNSYNSHGTSEMGPLARIPSPDPDHIDGLHRHGSHSSGHGSASASAPLIPPLPFEANTSSRLSVSLEPLKDLPDTPTSASHNPPAPHPPEKPSSLFSHPNSSAPALSTMTSAAPTLTHRSATAPSKRLAFATNLSVYDTFSASVYDRRSEPATWSRLTPALAQRIKEELNSYKMEEMEVHAASRIHTQFFV